ncbi:MAG: lipopolysaccharide core heptose(I) kinase RfaP [Gammaproteobacteria bacterium]
MLMIKTDINSQLSAEMPLFDQLMAMQGKVYRELENRRTQRVVLNDQAYFIKQHFGVGWREIIKNLCQLRLPITSAKNEWRALQRLNELTIPVPEIMAYGNRGMNPATQQSFLMTRELPEHITLEDLGKKWRTDAPTFRFKQKLIKEVARIARIMHENGINHRDFYICHLLLDLKHQIKPLLYLIDLHRAGIHKTTPKRWVIKDLAGLYFSSHEIGLTERDLLRFIKEYRNKSLRAVLTKEAAFWQRVKIRGDKLYRKHA